MTMLDDPFPAGIQQPHGSALGLLTGVGGAIEFVDQTKGVPRVHQYSAEVQRELRGQMAVTIEGPGAFGNAPRTLGDARYQFRKNVDIVLAKSMQFPGGQGEVRFEILNLTNTPKFRGTDSNAVDLPGFGRITAQAGFMRIWQLSFRYRF